MRKEKLYWLAGLLEGEGSFMKGPPSDPNRPRINLAMTDIEPVQEVADLMGIKYIYKSKDNRNKNWLPYYMVSLRGRKAIKMMEKLFPLMAPRRQGQIQAAIASHDPNKAKKQRQNKRKLTRSQVRKIRRAETSDKYWARQLADKFNVSIWSIYKIHSSKEYWVGVE